MNLTRYQELVAGGLFVKPDTDLLAHIALGLAGEAGEIADAVKKSQYIGRELALEHLREEAGDLLWYLTQLAQLLGTSIEQLAYENILKLHARYPDNYSHPSDA